MRTILVTFIKFYRLILSPFFGQHCRFYPSCSEYSIEAIRTHGSIKGSWLSVKRIGRCNPFCEGGEDPVPEKKLKISNTTKFKKLQPKN